MKTARIAVLLAACALGAWAQGEDEPHLPIYVEEDEAAPLLDQAAKCEREGRWEDAIEKYQRVLREHPDQVRRTEAKNVWTSVRRYVFERISKFPAEGRKAYLELNDSMAKSLFDQALKDRDLAALEKVANEFFFTSVGDDASLRIADLYAEEGRLSDAVFYWERTATLYPETDLPEAPLAAKWAAGCRRLGDEEGWQAARKKLEGLGGAKLRLSGKIVTAAEAAEALAKVEPAAARVESADEWPRLGGDNSGTRLTKASSRNEIRLWTWPDRTPEQMIAQAAAVKQASRTQQLQVSFMQYYPAVSKGTVVLADGAAVYALSLDTGKPLWIYPEKSDVNQMFMQVLRDAPRIMSMCAPVIANGRVIVNFLPRSVQWQAANPEKTWLSAIDLETSNELWSTRDEEKLAEDWFGSPPMVYGGRIYAAVASSGNAAPSVSLVVLDEATGKLLRRTFLCEGMRQNPGWGWMGAVEAPMVAEHGGVIFVNTNIGAVAAVHACTGEILWLTSYVDPVQNPNVRIPRRPVDTSRNGRGLNPMVVHEGRLCCVPGDVDNYCEFDLRTGRRALSIPAHIPTSPDFKVGQGDPPRYFLGIRGNKAWFSGARTMGFIDFSPEKLNREAPLKSQYAFALTGSTNSSGGGSAAVLGRGFLTEDMFYAATAPHLVQYKTQSAKLMVNPANATWDPLLKSNDAGHVVVVGNRLLCLSEAGLTCFTDQESFDRTFSEVLTAADPDPALLEKHAEVLARNPRTYPGAIQDYTKIAATSKDPVRVARARDRLMALNKALGDAKLAGANKDYEGAIEHYRKAVDSAPPDAPLGDLFRLMGDCHEKLNQWGEAVAMYQEVLTKYGDRMVTLAGGLTQSVRQFAEEKIAKIVIEHGPEVYDAIEKKASDLFEKVKEGEGLEELKKWWEGYPNSRLAPEAGRLMSERLAAAGRTAEAASVLVRLAERSPKSEAAPQVLARAAELFAQAGLWGRADATLARLERAYPGARVTALGKTGGCEEVAAAIRAGEPVAPAEGERKAPELACDWGARADDQAVIDNGNGKGLRAAPVLIRPTGRWAGVDPAKAILVTRLSRLEAHDIETDRVLWSEGDPRGWLGVGWKARDNTWDVQIGSVVAGSPAAAAGLQPEDIPEFWDGERVTSTDQMRRLIGNAAGKEIALVVRRGGERRTIRVQIGRREVESGNNEAPVSAAFLDCGLLVVVRPSSLEALDPATGRPVWVHYPVHPRSAFIAQSAACDDRVFLGWRPDEALSGPPSVAAPDVSLEALDGRTGERLWMLQESGVEVTSVLAQPGTGVVVKGEKRGAMAKLRVLNAQSGTEVRELLVVTTGDGKQVVASAWDGRLYYLRENNSLYVYDLNTHQETARDLGGQREYPASFQVGAGHIAIGYANLNRILVMPTEGAERAQLSLPPGRRPVEGGVRLAEDDRLYVMTVDETQQNAQLVRYGISKDGLTEQWVARMGGSKGALRTTLGFTTEVPGWIVYWGSPEHTGRPGTVGWLQ
ncbi:MAG: PQQ-binding-like beta-propeller repeat protein, partial [Planctomycetes bacterium]|nr:PQQ-binding-like beta-propeller repeat protein [Planctomycetota bacterium]